MGAPKLDYRIGMVASEADLIREVSRIIGGITGVQLGEKQVSLVRGRLSKRMRDVSIADPAEYALHYNRNTAVETSALISLLTTHHTYFFREFQHFEALLKDALPEIIRSHRAKGQKLIRIWSAACSRGQEVYSLAMFLLHHLPQLAPEMKFEIVGTDICEESVEVAKNGVYTWDEVKTVPAAYMQGNWSRGTGEIANFVKANDRLKERLSFKVVNLQALQKQPLGLRSKFDVIFCRNVFIYFSPVQIQEITREMMKMLEDPGRLFLGLSESLNGLDVPVDWVGPSVYTHRKPGSNGRMSRPAPAPSPSPAPGASLAGLSSKLITPAKAPWASEKIKVLCVDDSPTVIAILKRVISAENGFEIIGTAGDGIEAAEKMKTLRPDVITLDIHMPKMNGVEYLEKHRPRVPVVIVSSVPRDDAKLAFRCLELGAADYIEKPSAQNMAEISEELLFKMRVAVEAKRLDSVAKANQTLALDRSFKRPPLILKPEGKLRVVVANFAGRESLEKLIKDFKAPQPPTLVLLEGAGELLEGWVAKNAAKIPGGSAQAPKNLKELKVNTTSFLSFKQGLDLLAREGRELTKSVLIVGPVSPSMSKLLVPIQADQILLEDRGAENSQSLISRATLLVPLTSFVYESDRFFAEPAGGRGGRV
jgi:chemotaxis protein methyltransferase CheR